MNYDRCEDDGFIIREEAILKLELMRRNSEWNKDLNENLDYAIKALRHTESGDCVSRETVLNLMRYWGEVYTNDKIMEMIESLPPVTSTEQNEEDVLKFYYVESLDEYWIGQRCETRYYGKWTGNCFTYGYSRHLPWGEHVIAPNTLWKEHTYPSEPKEIPFNEWLQGFLEKECQTERTGKWIEHKYAEEYDGLMQSNFECSKCHDWLREQTDFCPNCGADMRGDTK